MIYRGPTHKTGESFMKAEELKIEDVLVQTKTFVIPPYQRPYSWGEDKKIRVRSFIMHNN